MKKKLTVSLIIFAIFSSSLFASFLQFGPTATYSVPIDLEAENPVDLENIDLESFTLGGDVRMNMFFLQSQAEFRGSFDKELRLSKFDAYAAANLRFNLVIADITVGGGLRFDGRCTDGRWTFNGMEPSSFLPILKASELFYRAGVALNFGRISITGEAIAPLNTTLIGLKEVKEQSVLDALTPDLSRTQVSVGVLFNLL